MKSVCLATLALASGCGRIDFDSAEAVDGCRWSPTPTFAEPARIDAIVDGVPLGDPTLSSDGLELYYAHYGSKGTIRRATRSSRDLPFGSGVELAELTALGGSDLSGFALHPEGLTAYFAWNNGSGNADLYEVTRSAPGDSFGAPRALTELNTAGHEFNPRVSRDGRTLIFVRWTDASNSQTADTYFAHRSSPAEPWSDIAPTPFSTAGPDAAATFADAGDIVFDVIGTMFVVHEEAGVFDTPRMLPIDTAAYDGLPFAASDGCELVFMSDRNGPSEIYSVSLL